MKPGRLWSEPVLRDGQPVLTEKGKPRRRRHDEGLRIHDLPCCLGQWTTDGGAPEKAAQAMLRHASADMTRSYSRTKEKGEVALVMGDVLGRRRAE
jgi:hypothetical protein